MDTRQTATCVQVPYAMPSTAAHPPHIPRMLSNPKTPATLAWLATLGTLVVSIFPALRGPAHFEQGVAMTLLQTLAVIWATYFAAGNIVALTRAEERETAPLIDCSVLPGDRPDLCTLKVANLGRGGAVDIRAVVWGPDYRGAIYPSLVALPRTHLFMNDFIDADLEGSLSDAMEERYESGMVVVVQYRLAGGGERTIARCFSRAPDLGERRFVRVPDDMLGNIESFREYRLKVHGSSVTTTER